MEGPTKEQIEESVKFTKWMEESRKYALEQYALEQIERRKQMREFKDGDSDAVNPAHYRVEGIPEAIEIIAHLMTREQLEGFFWGNIIKYAYRYGRKGDKAETAGKIAWYAQKLKELGECESK